MANRLKDLDDILSKISKIDGRIDDTSPKWKQIDDI